MTEVVAGLPPLNGMPAHLDWSDKVVRQKRPTNFQPKCKPGVAKTKKEEDPTNVLVEMIDDILEKFMKFSNQKRLEINAISTAQLKPLKVIVVWHSNREGV